MFQCVCVALLTLLSSLSGTTSVRDASGLLLPPPGCAPPGHTQQQQRGEGDQISARRPSGTRWRRRGRLRAERLPPPLQLRSEKLNQARRCYRTQSSCTSPEVISEDSTDKWWPMGGWGTTRGPGGGSWWTECLEKLSPGAPGGDKILRVYQGAGAAQGPWNLSGIRDNTCVCVSERFHVAFRLVFPPMIKISLVAR